MEAILMIPVAGIDWAIGHRLSAFAARRAACFAPAAVLLLLLFATPCKSPAQERWSAEVFTGTAWNLPLPLRIQQHGERDLRLRARYSTRPWRGAPYYAYRFGRWSDRGASELELIHHKLYLDNPPPAIQHFEISHGYNLANINRAAMSDGGTVVRLGFGLVIAHPEGQIRGRPVGPVGSLLGGGYHISGITAQLSVGHRVALSDEIFAAPEAKLTASYARIRLADGWAVVPNAALHALAGFGYIR
jgi:hypothetical protein